MHFWMNTEDQQDLAFIHAIAYKRPCTKTVYSEKPKVGMGVSRFFEYCCASDTVYIRIDDDMVYLDVNWFSAYIAFRKNNLQYFLVYANTINNSLCSHLHQRMGTVDYSLGIAHYDCFDPVGWSNGPFANLAHQSFLGAYECDGLDQFRFGTWQMNYQERLSTHVISWLGAEFDLFGGLVDDDDDEHWLSCVKPEMIKKPNVIYGSMLVSHFSYYTQREYMDQTNTLKQYKCLAVGE
ncbi:MAG: hypothetical protein ACI8P9_002233 [Parasphingorhabdus sp.]